MAKFTGELSGSLAFIKSGVVTTQLRPGTQALNLTGSFNITGSQLTFNGRDVIAEIDALSAGSNPDIGTLRIHSASMLAYTASNNLRVQALENVTGSISTLNAATSSYFLKTDSANVISSSNQILALGYTKDNLISGSQQLLDLGFKKDVLSGSQQILDLGFVTSSNIASYGDLSNVPGGILSSSAQVETLGFITGSDYSDIINKPSGIVSSSAQTLSYLSNQIVTASKFSGDGSGLTNISVGQVTSIRTDFDGTGSLTVAHNFGTQNVNVTTYDESGYQFLPNSVQLIDDNTVKLVFDNPSTGHTVVALGGHIFSGSSAWQNVTNKPSGIISSSGQITALGFVTSSVAGSGSVASGTVSSSLQISNLGFITGSVYADIINKPSGLVSSSAQITALGFGSGGEVNAGTVSSSAQISSLGFITGSTYADIINKPSGILSSSAQIEALGYITGSTFGSLSDVPGGLVSSSVQIAALGYITSSNANTDALNTFTGSIRLEVDALTAATSSYISNLNAGILSSSAQVEALGFITSSVGASVPAGTISSSLQISNLGFVTSSAGADVSGLNSKTGSYATTGSNVFVGNQIVTGSIIPGSGSNDLGTATAPWQHLYIQSGSIKFMNPDGTELSSFNNTFDGNQVISNTEHPLFNSFNPGTTGTIEEFLNAVFFPNTAPTISTGNQTIAEFTPSGSSIVTLAGSDAESQAITFSLDDTYTDGFVVVESGVLKLNVLPTTEAFNTDDRGDGTDAHPVILKATDTVGGTSTKTIYINVTTNTAPIFRETSVAGNQITSFTTSRNESAAAELVSRIFFTDAESDSITITSASDANGHFSITKYATYVELTQVTSSLDYESITQYNMSITASDEHAVAGVDSNAVTTLPITVNVTDNIQPTVNNQNLTGVNENSSDGASAGTITASDPEGNTITFVNSRLHSIQLDGFNVNTGSYSGTSQATDPHEDAFAISSNGAVTRKAGVFLNSDIIDKYLYEVTVTDAYNNGTDTGLIGIPIADDTAPTISGDTTLYVIESAVSGDNIYDNTNGYSGTTSRFTANQTVNWSVSSSNDFNISSTGYLTLARNISGSSDVGGDQLSGVVTATNSFGTATTQAFTVNITDNQAPNITFTNTSANLNTNKARANTNNLVSITFTDPEGNALDHNSFSASFAGGDLTTVKSGDSYLVRATDSLSAGTFEVTASIADAQGFATRTSSHSFTIAQAVVGSLSTNGTLYVIESSTNGDNIVLNSNGRSGTQGDLSVTYSPSYGSQAVQAFTSSNALVDVNASGNLTVGQNISGSGNEGGSSISSDITFQDQYGNVGSGSITVNITNNSAPDISFSDTSGNQNTNLARSGSTLVTISFSDTEGDGIDYNSFVFTDPSGQLNAVRSGDNYLVQANNNLSGSTYGYTASIADSHGFATNTETDSFTVAQASTGTLTGDTTIHIIESAESGSVFRDATGYNNGNAADVNVSYSPSYGSPSVQAFTSSNAAIVINNSGNLTLGLDISGSSTGSGDTIESTITYQDQYGNVGSGTVTANVFANLAPSVSITLSGSLETNDVSNGTHVGRIIVSDTEADYPISVALSGTNASDFTATATSGNGTVWNLTANSALSAGTYSFTATATDAFGKQGTDSDSITIAQSADYGLVYVYTSTYGSDAGFSSNYLGVMGGSAVNSDVPPEVTSYTANTASPYFKFKAGDVGSTSISLAGSQTATLRASGSGAGLDQVLSDIGSISAATTGQVIIVYPSGSDMSVPTSVEESFNSTAGGAVPCMNVDGNGFGIESGVIHSLTLDSAHLGYTEWFVFGRKSQNAIASSFDIRLVNASGSLPS